ncbi:hypothetical protein M408DRAFT_26455 [Serendipita vermifera MAFF 305830]|uniref:Uncharacterized protein n=1 Tax=Serendipita vermifera MAFF 305830 TaxID=933852 RepID=A0A0C3A5W0_SERVB|nr:hypothetical protein M408DRAFT_30695 [Serendipita vermifera MAFF 305830]KIM25267.1 hypothetical protein M408DRAFT_26455 [Serendipita vermifera MAFF 305830]
MSSPVGNSSTQKPCDIKAKQAPAAKCSCGREEIENLHMGNILDEFKPDYAERSAHRVITVYWSQPPSDPSVTTE